MNFPDRGEEIGGNPRRLVNEFEKLMLQAVRRELRADVPVGAYLSGGVDSSVIVALACHLKGPAINTYTIRVDAPELDELDAASLAARHIGAKAPIVQEFRNEDALNTYPTLIQPRKRLSSIHPARRCCCWLNAFTPAARRSY